MLLRRDLFICFHTMIPPPPKRESIFSFFPSYRLELIMKRMNESSQTQSSEIVNVRYFGRH